jgi:hypothetical protein
MLARKWRALDLPVRKIRPDALEDAAIKMSIKGTERHEPMSGLDC